MKTVTTAMLVVTLLIVVGWGEQANSSEEEGQPSEHPSVSIHMAALQGDIDAIRQHITAGSDLNEKDQFGSTPLIIATTFGKTEAARALIEAGADMEIRTSDGSTPLHVASFFCRTEIVKALLDKGANKHSRNMSGSTAFDNVAAPFDDDKGIYDKLGQALEPLGLELDYERIKMTRPKIAEMLRPRTEDLEAVVYAPLSGDDWKVSTPEEQGLDPMLVAELYLDATHMETLYGLLVIKNGYLIAEGYFNQGSVEQEARLQSATKSYTSALVGIELEQGCLSSVDQKMMDFFPELAGQITDPRKKQITVRHMLQMRAGYPWEETDPALWEGLLSGHYLPLIEKFPLITDPGTEFHYSNLTSNWLGIIVARACGTNLKAYAEERLFSLIDAEAGDWGMDRDGHNNGCGDLHATARDAAKFGLLYLNEGEHEGNQVVSADWIRESLQTFSENANSGAPRSGRTGRYFRDIGYGYQWWSARAGEHHFNYAAGHGGQLIILLDELDMIIVVTADPFYLQHDDEAWKHEQANINLVGKFIESLPKGETSKPE
ncbi:serine hydrolase [Candidatus Eisenbacteria bacterium]|uniref:Serine hydrolase n=1 Tax=Eiseniibacteriota bacterium TaxID=2212470 RepID=A0ABV6YMN1_UNCEI